MVTIFNLIKVFLSTKSFLSEILMIPGSTLVRQIYSHRWPIRNNNPQNLKRNSQQTKTFIQLTYNASWQKLLTIGISFKGVCLLTSNEVGLFLHCDTICPIKRFFLKTLCIYYWYYIHINIPGLCFAIFMKGRGIELSIIYPKSLLTRSVIRWFKTLDSMLILIGMNNVPVIKLYYS